MRVILPDRTIKTLSQSPRSIEQLLQEIGIKPFEVIVSLNGTLVPEDTVAADDDEVRIIRVAHGG